MYCPISGWSCRICFIVLWMNCSPRFINYLKEISHQDRIRFRFLNFLTLGSSKTRSHRQDLNLRAAAHLLLIQGSILLLNYGGIEETKILEYLKGWGSKFCIL